MYVRVALGHARPTDTFLLQRERSDYWQHRVHAARLDVGRNRVLLVLSLRSHTCRHWRHRRMHRAQSHRYCRLRGAIPPIDELDDAERVFQHMLTRLRRRHIVSLAVPCCP